MRYDLTLRIETDDIDAVQALLYQHVKPVYPFTIEALVRIHDSTPHMPVTEVDPRLYGHIHEGFDVLGRRLTGMSREAAQEATSRRMREDEDDVSRFTD